MCIDVGRGRGRRGGEERGRRRGRKGGGRGGVVRISSWQLPAELADLSLTGKQLVLLDDKHLYTQTFPHIFFLMGEVDFRDDSASQNLLIQFF